MTHLALIETVAILFLRERPRYFSRLQGGQPESLIDLIVMVMECRVNLYRERGQTLLRNISMRYTKCF
jgi:hypothetical protein